MNDTIIAFVLDKSGSMQAIWDDTIGGFNAFLTAQSAEPGAVRLSLTLFDSEVHMAHGLIPIAEAVHLARPTYVPGGQTALYDAVGFTISSLQRSAESLGRVLVVVLTDGHENASQAYSRTSLAALLEAKKRDGWEFLYLGAAQESWDDASALGAVPLAYRADAPGIAAAFCAVTDYATRFRREEPLIGSGSIPAEPS